MFFAHGGLEQLFLAGKIQKQCAFGHPARAATSSTRVAAKPFFDKQLQRGFDEFAGARFLATFAFDRSGGM